MFHNFMHINVLIRDCPFLYNIINIVQYDNIVVLQYYHLRIIMLKMSQ